MGKTASTPEPPDPQVVAAAQSNANQDTAAAQARLNMVNQVTPYGNLTYSPIDGAPTAPNGLPLQYTATMTLNPDELAALQSQQALTKGTYGLANEQLGRIQSAVSQPFDTSDLIKLPTDLQKNQSDVSDALYRQATSRLDPQFADAQTALETKLATQGIPVGSEAYSKAMRDFNLAKNDAYGSAINSSIAAGGAEQSRQAGLAQSLQQQQLQTQNYLREQPLNEAIALLSGTQIQNPNFTNTPQTSVAPTDVMGAYGMKAAGDQANAATKQASNNATTSAVGGIAAAAAMAAAIF